MTCILINESYSLEKIPHDFDNSKNKTKKNFDFEPEAPEERFYYLLQKDEMIYLIIFCAIIN